MVERSEIEAADVIRGYAETQIKRLLTPLREEIERLLQVVDDSIEYIAPGWGGDARCRSFELAALCQRLYKSERELDDENEKLKQQLTENPTVIQMLQAAPMLQWRRCRDCGHVGLHVENIDPWVRCWRCESMDTRQMIDASRKLQQLTEETDDAATL